MARRPASSPPTAWSARDLAGDPHTTTDKAARVRRMFDAIARRYDLNNRLHSFGRDQAWRRSAARLAGVARTDDVLDCACGTGDLAEAMADAGAASVTGVDFSPEMLVQARRKSARRRRRGVCEPRYVEADVTAMPFDEGTYDVVSIAFGIRNVADPPAALAEFRRVLRPGGRLVILEFGEPDNPLLRRLNRIYCNHVMPFTATLIAGDRSGAYRYLPRSIATFAGPAAMTAMIEDAGFDRPQVQAMTMGVCLAYVGKRRSDEAT